MAIVAGYHGTRLRIAQQYMDTQEVILSTCRNPYEYNFKDHWLGDGFYLWEEGFYAFKWITQQCFKKKTDRFDRGILLRRYSILLIKFCCVRKRIFDLRKLSHKLVFDRILKRITEQRIDDISIPIGKIPDGVVINYIFLRMDYQKRFDVVCAAYTYNESNYRSSPQTQQNFVYQLQYCIKVPEIVQSIEKFDFTDNLDEYIDMWETLFPRARPFNVNEEDIYTIDEGGSIYES